jgi:hypothetical protein
LRVYHRRPFLILRAMVLVVLFRWLKAFADVLRWQHRDVITLIISALLGVAAVALHLAIALLDVLAGVRSVSKSEAVDLARGAKLSIHIKQRIERFSACQSHRGCWQS